MAKGLRRSSIAPVALVLLAGCASAPPRPAPQVEAAAAALKSYSAELGVALRGRELRGRSRVLVAFSRPDALRVELPGPAGARLVAVARGGRLVAAFPAERAVYAGAAEAADLEALLGIALSPAEVMDLLVGRPVPRLPACRARWGARVPERIEATLPDGARLKVSVRAPSLDEPLPPLAFEEPAHAGYRALSREEARALWSAR